MAHQSIARQLAQLIFRQRDVAERPEPGIDTVRNLPRRHDVADNFTALRDTLPGAVAQRQGGTVPGNLHQFLPPERTIAPDPRLLRHVTHTTGST